MSSPYAHTLLFAILLALLQPPVAEATPGNAAEPEHSRCSGTDTAGPIAPTPADPYPLMAARWGPELGKGYMVSRWAEDWSGLREAGTAPMLKARKLGEEATLTVNAELRLRHVQQRNRQLRRGQDPGQTQLRAVLGADLRFSDNVRVYGELGVGQVDAARDGTAANFQNDASVQQFFVDARSRRGGTMLGAMLGRQEFSDGPRQLISLSDGPNLHRTWNGARVYLHGERYRIGAFDLRATRLKGGDFDDGINHQEILRGATASFIVSGRDGPNTYLDPFWFHTENPSARIGPHVGHDRRDTVGLRLWGRRGALRYDWTAAYQRGRVLDGRRSEAWSLFAVQSLELSDGTWKPRLGMRVDLASGGGTYEQGTLRAFHSLYASSNYLGEGQLLGLSNLAMVAPSLSVSPTSRTSFTFEYGYAQRLEQTDVVYAGGMRAYPGTQNAPGRHIGNLARLSANWSPRPQLTLTLNLEHLAAGSVLHGAGYPSGSYGYLSATYRY